MVKLKIAYCKIFPSIGIARVGDSTNPEVGKGWFLGPEFNNERPSDFSFKDAEGKIKRQATRFRIYAFDKENNPIKELTSDDAEITWTVSLANKKAAWFNFSGTETAIKAFRGKLEKNDKNNIRNSKVGSINLDSKNKYIPSKERAEFLEINGGTKIIKGKSINDGFQFYGNYKKIHKVYLGELKTDSEGRLIVLGGHGISDAIDEQGNSIKNERWIRNYANNDDWYDDVSDGPVNAKVVLKNGHSIDVKEGAWIIVTPPDFAPDIKSIVTLYDVMEEVAWNNKDLLNKSTPELNYPQNVSFNKDIRPIFERMHNQRWINSKGLRGHGTGKPGDFQKNINKDSSNDPSQLDEDLLSKSDSSLIKKQRIFDVLREPVYLRVINDKLVDDYKSDKAINQAVTTFMPPLAGDEGDPVAGNPKTWLSLTYLQYERFILWSQNKFSNEKLIDLDNIRNKIESLTKNILGNCTGGPFYPGIEMTSIARDPKLYCEAFRLNNKILEPGDITKFMALPWQADFWECQLHWWPAQRPDDIIPEEDFEALFNKFTKDIDKNYEMVLFNREKWDRGIGIKSRPSNSYLKNRILPEVGEDISTKDYIELLSTGKSNKIINIKFDSLSFLLKSIAGIDNFMNMVDNPIKDSFKLPSPWRLQYTAQESLDTYSGLYFHLIIPSPFEVFDVKNVKGRDIDPLKAFTLKSIEYLQREWSSFRIHYSHEASKILGFYANEVYKSIVNNIRKILIDCPFSKKSLKKFRDFLINTSVSIIETNNVYNDFNENHPIYFELRAAEMIENVLDYLYMSSSINSGDMDMVNDWRKLGFVVKQEKKYTSTNGEEVINTFQVETERSQYDGKSFRDFFYYLMNIEDFPDFITYSKKIVDEILTNAQKIIDDLKNLYDSDHPESFVEYSKETFNAKLHEIYEILRKQAYQSEAFRTDRTKTEWTQRHLDSAPFNQTDGSWLRFIANAGTTDNVVSLLFEVWSDEIGNGNPALHHGNLFTQLLESFGIYLPPISSRAYADNPDIHESLFISPVFQLAISQNSETYFPEILGMTLYLEWEVLSLVPAIKGRDYMGIDSHFWEMHVGIDNASHGHGAKAKEAIEIYLDKVQRESGNCAMQEEWGRIWNGFVAFATAGYGYFSNTDVSASQRKDLDLSRKHKSSPQDKIKELMVRKAQYGSLNHLGKSLGGNRINDLFDERDIFVEQLANSPYIVPGNPDESKLLNHLTTFQGPMYKVFDQKDLELWKEWIIWLGKEGDTNTPKRYINKAESMFILLNELSELAKSSTGHKMYKIKKTENKNKNSNVLTIADFFNNGDLQELMRALKQEKVWVVPYDPGSSPLVIDFARANREMGAALDRRFLKLSNQIGRTVLIKWVEAGCPLIDEEPSWELRPPPSKLWDGKRLLVQQIGMGAVH